MVHTAEDVDTLWDDDLDLEEWLVDVSKFEKRYDLEPAIRRCLRHPEPGVRAVAISALGYYLQVDGFGPEAESFIDGEHDTVALAAVLAWAFHHRNTGDPAVVLRLLAIARDPNRSRAVRAAALGYVPKVIGSAAPFPVDTIEAVRVDSEEAFQSRIDWDAVDRYVADNLGR